MKAWPLALAGLLVATSARAEEAPPGRWIVDLGLAARERPDHIGARSYTTDLWPLIEAQYGSRLHISLDDGLRWSAVKSGPISFGPVVEYRQAFNEKLAPRTDRLSDAIEIGGFAQAETGVGSFEARLRHAVIGYDGNSADLAFDTGGAVNRRLAWTLEARASWADNHYVRRLVGARAAAPSTPVQRTYDYITTGFQAGLAFKTSAATTLSLQASEDRIVSHLPHRFAASRDLLGLNLALTYRFGHPAR